LQVFLLRLLARRPYMNQGRGEECRLQRGVWVERPIPDRDLRISPQSVFWIDTISFTDATSQPCACVS
jgi:hypothetical protein